MKTHALRKKINTSWWWLIIIFFSIVSYHKLALLLSTGSVVDAKYSICNRHYSLFPYSTTMTCAACQSNWTRDPNDSHLHRWIFLLRNIECNLTSHHVVISTSLYLCKLLLSFVINNCLPKWHAAVVCLNEVLALCNVGMRVAHLLYQIKKKEAWSTRLASNCWSHMGSNVDMQFSSHQELTIPNET